MKAPVLFMVVVAWLCQGATLTAARPNILLILADDLGVGDIQAFTPESKIPTPNLDRLIREGRRFDQAYCPVAICSPTRFALMTGRLPWRSWKKAGVLANWERPLIENCTPTLASMLGEAGYVTAGFGKWHLGATYRTTDGLPPLGMGKFKSPDTGRNLDLSAPVSGGPVDRGFQHWHGFICASEMLVFEGNRPTAILSHDLYPRLSTPGVEALREIPLKEYATEVTARSVAFLKKQASRTGEPYFLYYAPYVPHIPLVVQDAFRGKSQAGDYGDYVHQLDHEIGLLLKALDETGLAASTLVIFASDNGSQFETAGENHHPNGSLRGGKHTVWEGGVRTPFFIRWPGQVPAGTQCGQLMGLHDLLPTLAGIIGEDLEPGTAPDGINLAPLWLGRSDQAIRRALLVGDGSRRVALIEDQWKYVSPANGDHEGELYHLATDPGEKTNLATTEPERAARMAKSLRQQKAALSARPAKAQPGTRQ